MGKPVYPVSKEERPGPGELALDPGASVHGHDEGRMEAGFGNQNAGTQRQLQEEHPGDQPGALNLATGPEIDREVDVEAAGGGDAQAHVDLAAHPQLYISRSDTSLEVSVLPLPATVRAHALSLLYYFLMLTAGGGAIGVVLGVANANWPALAVAGLWISGCVLSIAGVSGLCFTPRKLLPECAHEVLHFSAQEMVMRYVVWGYTWRCISRSITGVSGVHLRLKRRRDGSSWSICVIKEGSASHKFGGRLPKRAQRHALLVISEFIHVPIGNDEWMTSE